MKAIIDAIQGPRKRAFPVGMTDSDLSGQAYNKIDELDPSVFYSMPLSQAAKALGMTMTFGPGDEQKYQGMNPQMRMDFWDKIINTPRPQPDKQSRFDDAGSYQTADLDAFKLMQIDPDYGATATSELNTTEAGRLALLRRMMFADAALEDPRLTEAMTSPWQNFGGMLGAPGRIITNDEYELGRLMAEQFANAVLRLDSGAQAPEAEVQRYVRQFFPLAFEGKSQLDAKKSTRRETVRAIMQALSNEDAAPAVNQLVQEMDALKAQADDGGGEWAEINGVRVRKK